MVAAAKVVGKTIAPIIIGLLADQLNKKISGRGRGTGMYLLGKR